MEKFYGVIGLAIQQETAPDVWEDIVVEKPYYGDVLRHNYRNQSGGHLNNELTLSNEISIVSDLYLLQHCKYVRYIKWHKTYWSVTAIEIVSPRVNITLGGVYNGPKTTSTP